MARYHLKYRVTGLRETSRYFSNLERRSIDFRPVFRWARREFEKAWRENIVSQGARSGASWQPLDPEYAAWKLEEYGPLPTMIRTGNLLRSVSFLHGPPNDIGMRRATFGTSLKYAAFQDTGTKEMPKRDIIFVPADFTMRFARQVGDWVVEGRAGDVPFARLRSLFSR